MCAFKGQIYLEHSEKLGYMSILYAYSIYKFICINYMMQAHIRLHSITTLVR